MRTPEELQALLAPFSAGFTAEQWAAKTEQDTRNMVNAFIAILNELINPPTP